MTQYQSYRNTKNKLLNVWNKVQEIAVSQFQKHNELKKLVHERNKIKNYREVLDTGWFPVLSEQASPARMVTVRGEKIPTHVTVEQKLEFNIDDDLLPFLDVNVLVKPQPDQQVYFTYTDTIHGLGNNIVEIKGDSTTLYKGGTFQIASNKTVYTQDDIDNGVIHPTFNKIVNRATVVYTDGSDTYRVIGKVNGLKLREPLGTGCDGLDFNLFHIFDFHINGSLGEEAHQKIIKMTPSTVHFISTNNQNLFVGDPGSCSNNSTIIDEYEDTVSWADLSEEQWWFEDGVRQKFEDGEWVNAGLSGQTIQFGGVSGNTVISRSFEEIGFWLYGGAVSKFRLFLTTLNPEILYPDNCRGTQQTYFLPGGTLDTLGWGTMTIEYNPSGFPETVVKTNTANANEFNKQIFFKKTQNAQTNTYQLHIKRNFLIVAPANKLLTNAVDSYTHLYVGTTPSGITCHDTTKQVYEPDLSDTQVRIILSLKNPLYWTENKRE